MGLWLESWMEQYGTNMNKRIRELEKQAEEYADSTGLGFAAWRSAQLNKFAELIVRECAEVVKWTPSLYPNDTYVKNIKEHFGVEE
jgi:hypothetical protein